MSSLTVLEVTGYLEASYAFPDRDCADLTVPTGTSLDELTRAAAIAAAQPSIRAVESRKVLFEDDVGDVVATAVTENEASLWPSGGALDDAPCRATSRFRIQLPGLATYAITIEGVAGVSDPVTDDLLRALKYQCFLSLHYSNEIRSWSLGSGYPCSQWAPPWGLRSPSPSES